MPGVWNEKMTFPEFNAVKQMDVAFDEMQDADHHNSPSPMSELGIGMVSQFVIVNFQTRLKAKCVSDPTERLNVSSAGTQQYIKLLSHNRVSHNSVMKLGQISPMEYAEFLVLYTE